MFPFIRHLFSRYLFTMPSFSFLPRFPFSPLRRFHTPPTSPTTPPSFHASTPSPRYTPQDVVTFRRSPFAYTLTHLCKRHHPIPFSPDPPTPLDGALTYHGLLYEQQIVDQLLQSLSEFTNLPEHDLLCTLPPNAPDETLQALKSRVPLIRNPTLRNESLSAYADILLRADLDPFIGEMQRQAVKEGEYVVLEVKLASTVSAEHALQAAAYVHLLDGMEALAGVKSANWAYVVSGGERKRLRAVALRLLWRRGWGDFENFVKGIGRQSPRPEGLGEEMRPWRNAARIVLESADSLRLVAGIKRSEIEKVQEVLGVRRLEEFANMEEGEITEKVEEGQLGERYLRLWRQARMQMETRRRGKIAFEVVWEGGGVLPRRKDGDVMFDMEGFPLVKGGLEYLFGALGDGEFLWWWAHDRDGEERAFVGFVEWLRRRLEVGDGYVYHYGHYEVTAMRRVGLRARTAEGCEASRWLEGAIEEGRFVDIYKVVKECLVVGEQSYSIKTIEKLVGISREGDELADAESSVGLYHEWRRQVYEECDGANVERDSHPILQDILKYNRQDCESLEQVVGWLRTVLPEIEDSRENDESGLEKDDETGEPEPEHEITPGACGRSLQDKVEDSAAIRRCSELSQLLLRSSDPRLDIDTRRNLSQLLHFHVRESIPARIQFADRLKTASGPNYKKLLDDDQCLCAITFVRERKEQGAKTEKISYEYIFPRGQPVSFSSGTSAALVVPSFTAVESKTGKESKEQRESHIAAFMTVKGLAVNSALSMSSVVLSVGLKKEFSPPPFGVLISSDDMKICNAPLRKSLLRSAERIHANRDESKFALTVAFLNRTEVDAEPLAQNISALFKNRETRRENIGEFLGTRKEPCVFVIQGPPGSGKTSLSGGIIRDLVMEHGKTVAVSSNSHAAIDNLLSSAVRAGTRSDAVWKVGTRSSRKDVCFKANLRDLKVSPYAPTEQNHAGGSVIDGLSPSKRKGKKASSMGSLVGATCYQLAREDSEGKFDFLFVDEASQVTIANFLAMAPCSKYAVLVGDQMQLEMPIKGNHPEEIEQSCLTYVVGADETTVGSSRGVFLEKSYRMNPGICEFVSTSFYENTLSAAANCRENRVHIEKVGTGVLQRGEGIVFLPCNDAEKHDVEQKDDGSYGTWHKPAEVRIVAKVVEELLGCKFTVNGKSGQIGESDILVVAPYNAQVRALKDALPCDIRVGTVDKFQGQEAAVAIISTCTSDISDLSGADEEEVDFDEDIWNSENGNGVSSGLNRKNHRGLRFALRKNRLNVAISRAQCLSIVTGDAGVVANMPMKNLSDVDIAAVYEQIMLGSGAEGK